MDRNTLSEHNASQKDTSNVISHGLSENIYRIFGFGIGLLAGYYFTRNILRATKESSQPSNSDIKEAERLLLRTSTCVPKPFTNVKTIQWREASIPRTEEVVTKAELIAKYNVPDKVLSKNKETLVLLSDKALKVITEHVTSDTRIEVGGVMCGKAYIDRDTCCQYSVVTRCLPALYGRSYGARFEFTAEAWHVITTQLLDLVDEQMIGWYHSHPGFGVFLSSTDLFTQKHFFPHSWQVALVIDPIRNDIGVFVGENGTRVPHALF